MIIVKLRLRPERLQCWNSSGNDNKYFHKLQVQGQSLRYNLPVCGVLTLRQESNTSLRLRWMVDCRLQHYNRQRNANVTSGVLGRDCKEILRMAHIPVLYSTSLCAKGISMGNGHLQYAQRHHTVDQDRYILQKIYQLKGKYEIVCY